jgi:hypothetical protein
MKKLTCKLNGKRYLLVKCPVTKDSVQKIELAINKFECLYQGFGYEKPRDINLKEKQFIKILIPEENVISFNNEAFKTT